MSVKTGEKKPGLFKKLGRKTKEVFSELKKVTWPSFGKVVKTTGVVCAVVIFFLIAIGFADFILSELIGLVTGIGG
jgi:preprotein translocase SecE subunit